ncbi:hypothetical protein P389DRAFT_29465 [Cystobasidium minutum MCA 4210]|uniref:uncharacterized protein n=1 Tax=Cystobasidium minutum MCA 4210 TaxID=1397322 RepID=UPI0034CDC2A6|eukprot:jgi/Rhomi1/29465/CE29464_39
MPHYFSLLPDTSSFCFLLTASRRVIASTVDSSCARHLSSIQNAISSVAPLPICQEGLEDQQYETYSWSATHRLVDLQTAPSRRHHRCYSSPRQAERAFPRIEVQCYSSPETEVHHAKGQKVKDVGVPAGAKLQV